MKNDKALEHTNRLDVEVTLRGLTRSRSSARDSIERGKISVNGVVTLKVSSSVYPSDIITITDAPKFVSRGGEKLDHALETWKIPVSDKTALDIGSSTGGFADCLLQHDAAKVIAVDVGDMQFDSELRLDPRIELHENTDIRKFSLPTSTEGPTHVDMVVADVSFISLTHILPKIFEFLKPKAQAILLVKPQFEVGREIAQKRRGIITDDAERFTALENVKTKAQEVGLTVIAHIDSPIEGEGGNREFLLLVKK